MKSFIIVLYLMALTSHSAEVNWPQFRGPKGSGVSSSPALPLEWSVTKGVKWSTPIHGRGWSSPVIWGDQLWISTGSEDARELSVLCLNSATGEIQRNLKLFLVEKPQFIHPFNSPASPTPVIEEGRLYVTFGSPGTACLDTATGKVLWERRDLECNHFRGAGSSPILYRDLLIVNYDGSDFQYVVALDKNTGQTVWKRDRSIDFQDLGPDGKPQLEGDYRKAFATCHVSALDGRDTLLSPGSRAFYAYDPLTGEELWRVEERTSYSASTRPVVGHGLVFAPSGFATGQLLAIRPGRPGEILDAKTTHSEGQLQVVWRVKRSVPKKPSVTLLNDLLYAVDDNGTATCWEANSGAEVWSERIGGHYSASPLIAGNRLYLFSEEGKVTVLATGREFHKLAENQMPEGFMASPAVSGNALFLRTRKAVYRIQD
jgi:outer membrane protein assembly factor BamB